MLTLRATREPVSDSPLLQVRLSGVPHLLSYLHLSLGAVRPRSQGAPLVGGGPHSTDCLWQGQQTKQQVSGRPPPYHHTNMVFDGGCHVTLLHSSPYVYTVTMPLYPIVNVLVTQTLSCCLIILLQLLFHEFRRNEKLISIHVWSTNGTGES